MASRDTFSNLSAAPVLGTAFLAQYAARLKTLFDASAFPLTDVSGTGNAVTAQLDPPLDAGGLVNGMKFTITWAAANTGAVTLAINGGSAVPVIDADGAALTASALVAGRRSLIEYILGAFRILSSAGGAGAGAGPAYQAFTSSGTWTKPSGYDDDTVVMVEVWGAGGGGGRSGVANFGAGGGGGGSYAVRFFRMADLPSSVTVTIGAGGTGAITNVAGGIGGNTTFGALLTGFGGGGGGGGAAAVPAAGGGGGGENGPGTSAVINTPGVGGSVGGAGGGVGSAKSSALTIHGGGGGSPSQTGTGGDAVYGGAGGGGGVASGTAGGISKFGGNGGAGSAGTTPGGAGSAPGGGGGGCGNASGAGAGGAGARGECRITIFG
jgi:hypothetical protein